MRVGGGGVGWGGVSLLQGHFDSQQSTSHQLHTVHVSSPAVQLGEGFYPPCEVCCSHHVIQCTYAISLLHPSFRTTVRSTGFATADKSLFIYFFHVNTA